MILGNLVHIRNILHNSSDFIKRTCRFKIKKRYNTQNYSTEKLKKLDKGVAMEIKSNPYRLPDTVVPISYELTLKPHLKTGLFDGEIDAYVNILEPIKEIRLNTKSLKIEHVKVNDVLLDFVIDEKHEMLTIMGNSMFQPGKSMINILFGGDMRNRIIGLYSSSYTSGDKKVLIATSKFEPTYARQAFPCFDEPNKKTHFKVHLLKPKDPSYIALFNMPQINETETAEGIMVDFQESVKMSTYLSAFIVSDFKATNDTITSKQGDIPLRVFAAPPQLSKTEYARDIAKKVMEFYLDYFNIPYPLPKLDLVAIPDFVSGATEHWGLVTFRETALLYDPSISTTRNKERVATVIAHELAHSWFGNLVTMNWWNDLWLNEGFASYIEYKGLDAAEPTWQMLDQFPHHHMHSVLRKDATLASHPIVQTVETPDEITAIFDAISYNKGASILRMLESSVGDEIFQQAVTNYLIKHQFKNAITQDLLDQLQVLVKDDINITQVMNTWTIQMGYPVVNVKKTDGGYELTQKRFLTNEDVTDKAKTPYKWTIPITYFTSENSTPTQIWFDHDKESITIKTDANWIKLNSKQIGYYRANYGLDNWNALHQNIMTFYTGDRSHLIEESFELAKANQLHYNVPLNLSKYLITETDYIPWAVASSAFKNIKQYLRNSPLYPNFKEYVINLVSPAYTNYTWDDSRDKDYNTRLARVVILDLACSVEHTECLEEANKKFRRWLSGEEVLSQDLKDLIYQYGLIEASKEQWGKVWDRFAKEGDAGEKLRLLRSLASINNVNLISRLIDLAKDETYIRSQDYFSCLGFISANPIGTNYVWEYVRENWETLVKRFGLNDRHLGLLIPTITATFGSESKLEEMKTFFKKYPEAGAGASARVAAITTVENNITWVKKNREIVEMWLIDNKNGIKS